MQDIFNGSLSGLTGQLQTHVLDPNNMTIAQLKVLRPDVIIMEPNTLWLVCGACIVVSLVMFIAGEKVVGPMVLKKFPQLQGKKKSG